jgi:hypothetical protein
VLQTESATAKPTILTRKRPMGLSIVSYPIDIPGILGQNSAFVGFTAGTGSATQNRFIVDWFLAAPTDSDER